MVLSTMKTWLLATVVHVIAVCVRGDHLQLTVIDDDLISPNDTYVAAGVQHSAVKRPSLDDRTPSFAVEQTLNSERRRKAGVGNMYYVVRAQTHFNVNCWNLVMYKFCGYRKA